MLGQQITSSGVMPLQRNVITSQFPFVPRPSSNYGLYGATIPNQPQFGLEVQEILEINLFLGLPRCRV